MSLSKIIKVNATKSTNDKVKMLIKSKKIESGDIIVAKYQYGGRGQNTNKWYSSYGKNLIGSFYQPKLVISDTSVLKTLSKKDFICGYAEILKHAIIKDKKFFK